MKSPRSVDKLVGFTNIQAIETKTVMLVIGVLAIMFAAPYFLTSYYVYILATILIMGLVAMGFNLLFGYTGLLSFGHAAFFGAGAYTVGMLMYYFSIKSFLLLILSGTAVSAVVAAIIGYISLRHVRIFFALLTLALAQVLYILAVKLYYITHGTDGFSIPTPSILGFDFRGVSSTIFLTSVFYYVVLLIFIICIGLLWIITNSPFGLTLQTIRDNPVRAESIGIPVKKYRWYATILSGTFSGLAGSLFAFLNGHISPEILNWPFSGQIVFMTLLGGPNTFYGPIVGAAIFVLLKTYALAYIPDYWQLVVGSVLIVIVIFSREGVMGLLKSYRLRR